MFIFKRVRAENPGLYYDQFESYKTIRLIDLPDFGAVGNQYLFKKDDPSKLIFANKTSIFEFCIVTLSMTTRYEFNTPKLI